MIHWRYIGWLVWTNLITIIQVLQLTVAGLMAYAQAFSHNVFLFLVASNALLSAIVAQVKRNNPPGPRPEREHDPD